MKLKIIIFLFVLLGISLAQAQTRSPKRGLGYTFPTQADVEVLAPAMAWNYNWGTNNSAFAETYKAKGIDVVPMAWNGTNAQAIRDFKAIYPDCQYILAFNEPNLTDQANMTPAQAAAKWGELKAIANELGLKIISPAMNYGTLAGYSDPIKWLDEFFSQPGVSIDDIDGISIHCYMNYVSAMKSYVERFRKYNKPIWMTEFCAWEGNNITTEFQRNFLVESFNYLETEPLVGRYAWFIGRGWSDGYPYMQLLHRTQEGVLKELGEIFVHMSSYDAGFYHAIETQIEAEHYLRSSEYNHLEKTEDVSGAINLCDYFLDSWTDYQIDVPTAGEYTLNFRVAAKYEGKLKATVGDEEIASITVNPTDLQVWQTISCKANLGAGKQTVRITVTKGRVNFNWWSITGQTSAVHPILPDNLQTYPNPVTDKLYVNGQNVSMITVFDLSGKKLLENQKSSSIDVSFLKTGVYLATVQTVSGEKVTRKIVKN
jgi:hypothetical protein